MENFEILNWQEAAVRGKVKERNLSPNDDEGKILSSTRAPGQFRFYPRRDGGKEEGEDQKSIMTWDHQAG